jgi:transposase
MRERREYTKEFKEAAADLVRSSGRKSKDAAEELGISPENVRRWVREAAEGEQRSKQAFTGKGNARDEEVARLRKRVADLEETNEILKKRWPRTLGPTSARRSPGKGVPVHVSVSGPAPRYQDGRSIRGKPERILCLT